MSARNVNAALEATVRRRGGAGASMHRADPHAPLTKVKLDVIARLFSILFVIEPLAITTSLPNQLAYL